MTSVDVTTAQLTPRHWVAIADLSKHCIAFVLTSQIDGVEFFTSLFPVLFEIPATTQQNPCE
jgi:hypothetical protein